MQSHVSLQEGGRGIFDAEKAEGDRAERDSKMLSWKTGFSPQSPEEAQPC